MSVSWKSKQFRLGACYYPEQWPKELWESDFRRMRELGFSVIRMAEFAWNVFEPQEGQYQFDLFDEALDLAHQFGLQVIMGTPTATPPAWLTSQYPETLNVSKSGVPYQHGMRRHYNYNSPVYREYSARIVTVLAEHYRDHPAIIGWQIDNELNCEVNVFYSDADHRAFRKWLQDKYGSLDKLNEAWGTVFWNQTYTDWAQVHLTRPAPSDSANPHQALDEKRFISDSAISFAQLQAEILREKAPNQWITTNGLFGHLDSHELTEKCLDMFSYDSYPQFSSIYPDDGPEPLLDRKWSLNLSRVRSISPQFCVMEQQSGPGGWVNRMVMPSPEPGQMRLWTYQSIAHGADMLLYFRWRTASFGTEIYWHGINDYHNGPNRRLTEAGQIGEELQRVGELIVGKQYQAQVALLSDYDNEWDGELDQWHGPLQGKSETAWFKALQRQHIPADALRLTAHTTIADLQSYKVLVYPHPAIISEEKADLLKAYVEQGGILVCGCRTGYKDENGHCPMRPMPGLLADLFGVTVADFSFVGPLQSAPALMADRTGLTEKLEAAAFVDVLNVQGSEAQVLYTYAEGYRQGLPAAAINDYGKGKAIYFGSAFTKESADAFIRLLQVESPLRGKVELPADVELSIRADSNGNERIAFLLNYANHSVELNFHQAETNLLNGDNLQGHVTMKPYEVIVFRC